MLRTFEQIRDEVFALPNTIEEEERLNEELELFEERGWNQYIAFAINYLREMNDKVRFYFPSLSAMDSLFANKAIHPDYNHEKLLSKTYSKDVLFNDALRLGIDIVYADQDELNYLYKISALIYKDLLMRLHLNSKAKGIMSKVVVGEYDKIVCAISPNTVPQKDFNVIYNEKSDGPREEIEVLSKYFILYVRCKVGI